jgi:hypothetical protein
VLPFVSRAEPSRPISDFEREMELGAGAKHLLHFYSRLARWCSSIVDKRSSYTPAISYPGPPRVSSFPIANIKFWLIYGQLRSRHRALPEGPHRPACGAYWPTVVRDHVGPWEHKKGQNAVTSGRIRSIRPIGRHRTAKLSATLSAGAQQSDRGEPRPDSPSPTR